MNDDREACVVAVPEAAIGRWHSILKLLIEGASTPALTLRSSVLDPQSERITRVSQCLQADNIRVTRAAHLFLQPDQAGPLFLEQPLKSLVLGIIELQFLVVRFKLQGFECRIVS